MIILVLFLSHSCVHFSAPRKERSLLLEPLSESIADVSEFFGCSNVPFRSENKCYETQRIFCKHTTSPRRHLASVPTVEDSSHPSMPVKGSISALSSPTSASQTSACQNPCLSANSFISRFPLWTLHFLTMKSPYISSQISWTKFISLILSRTRSLVSWEKGI